MKNPSPIIHSTKPSLRLTFPALLVLAGLMALLPAAHAANGTASFLDFDGTNPGFGSPTDTSETALNWSTSNAGTAATAARPTSTQLTIGNATSDFAGTTFGINLNGGGNLNGVLINSTSVNVTFTGNANTHLNVAQSWTVPAGSTLTVNNTRQSLVNLDNTVKGMNWNNQACLFLGGGTINFPTPFGCNSTASNNMNMPGGTINLQMGVPGVLGPSTYSGGFTLTAGTLNFASQGSSNAFNGFIAGKNFYINGGTIDNTSGSPIGLRLNAGGIVIGGSFTFTGGSSMDFGPAAVSLNASPTVTVGANNLTIGGPISGAFGITKAGAGSLTLGGSNTFTGALTVTNGSTLSLANVATLPNGALVLSGSTLDMSAQTVGSMSTPTFSVTNSTINLNVVSSTATNIVTSTLNVGGTSTINISAVPLITGYPSTFHLLQAGTVNGTLNFALGSIPTVSPPYNAFITNRANGVVDLVITSGPVPVRTLTWNGLNTGSPDGTWDVATTPTWLDAGHNATIFNQSDIVTFNDTAAGTTSISMNGTLMPGLLTISNITKTITLGGSGKISGPVSLTKQGAGTLVLDETSGNDFGGNITISAGTLQVGANDSAGYIPATASIFNNGSLVFTRPDTTTIPNVISGSGSVVQNSPGVLTLAAANTFTGTVTVAQGTLQIGNNAALGTTNGGTTIASGATLDFVANANNIGQEPVIVSGQGVGQAGALYNSSGSATFVAPNIARLTLADDTYFGGSGRWDLRSSTTGNPTLASLSTGGLARRITKVGGNQIGLVGVAVDPQLGDIDVQSGIFSIEAATTSLGNPANSITVWPGATFQMFAITNFLDKIFMLGSDGIANSVSATSGSNVVVGPMTLTNDCFFSVNNGVQLTLNGVINGPGKLTKVGSGLLTLGGSSPNYTGALQLNGGNLVISGTISNGLGVNQVAGKLGLNGSLTGTAGLTNAASTVFFGSGVSSGMADASGIIYPGDTNVAGTLTVAGLILEPGASVTYDLTTGTTPGSGVNDLIVVNGDLVISGNAITINPQALLLSGSSYRLFNYTGNLIWNGDLLAQNQGNATYTYSINTNTPGQINLVVTGGGPPVWNGGSPTTSNWSDPANWNGVTVSSGPLYFGGTARLNNNNDTPADTSYGDISFIAGGGNFVLNGNPIIPIGNIVNASASLQTIDLGIDFNANFTLDGGAAGLVIGGGLTNLAVNPTKTTITLAGKGTLTNLLASVDATGTNTISMTTDSANWTLMDNAASSTVTVPWAFDILAGVFNFGTAGSAPKLSTTTVNGGPQDHRVGNISGSVGTFNMVNGTFTTVARLNTATVINSTGIVNQVGGTLNIGQQFQGANGANANEMSIVNVSGGTMNIDGGTGQFYDASRGNGILTVSGSGVLNCGTLDISRSIVSGTVGIVNLNGGTLRVTRVGTATANQTATSTGSTATFNFNGGTLKANTNSTAFFQGSTVAPIIPIATIVKSGGAIIDSDTNAITALEPLQHDSTLGATPDGGLKKLGPGTLTLTAASTYTGPTAVSNGTLFISGSLATGPVIVENGTLAGTGTLGGAVTIDPAGTIAPGGAGTIGTLTASGNITLSGKTAVEVNRTAGTKDLLVTSGNLTYGGALTVTNLAGTLAAGDSFKLFNAATYGGSFASISPTIPGNGLGWDTSSLVTSGTLKIVATVNTNPTNITAVVSGSTLTLSWPADHIGWHLQVQTNPVTIGLSTNWVEISSATSTNQVTVPLDSANGTVFYRMFYPR